MGFDLNVSVPALTVFLQGLISFFSPCVFPLIPLYIGYLSGGAVSKTENGEAVYDQKKVLLHTFCFVLGVSFAFFLLGLGVSAVGRFLNHQQILIARIGGIIVFLFGLYQLGILGNSVFLSKDRRLPISWEKMTMSPLTALIMGFSFSFAWTPCVGPALASVLLMTASAKSQLLGFLLIGLYTLGFVIPFLLLGVFTTKLLALFKRHRSVVRYTVKIGGVLMVLMGIMMFTGKMNSVTGYLSRISGNIEVTQAAAENSALTGAPENASESISEGKAESVENTGEGESSSDAGAEEPVENASDGESANKETDVESVENTKESEPVVLPALDFTLQDQFGNTHSLADYKGKTIFLNFWATWCPPCRREMPDIQKLYEEYPTEGEDAVIILGVAGPNYGQEGSEKDITEFLDKNGYSYPVLMDTKGELFDGYGIYSFPTTFMIDRDGNVFGYVTGQLSEDIMRDIIGQTLSGEKRQ